MRIFKNPISKIFNLTILCLIVSCASIPKESVDLVDVAIVSGEKAHDLNIVLTNQLYKDKKDEVDEFIDGEYTKEYWKTFSRSIPAGVDINENMNSIIPSISREINAQRSEMKSVLEKARLETIFLIDKDYELQQKALLNLKDLLISAAKVDETRRSILQQYSNDLNLGFNIQEVEIAINEYLNQAGEIGADVDKFGIELLKKIEQLKK